MENQTISEEPHNEVPSPRFGSKEWIILQLQRKFEDTPDKPAVVLVNATEYLKLRKLQTILFKPKRRETIFTWEDPPGFDQP